MNETRPILSITGSDSTGGSGIQADIRTISELGGTVVTAVTSITVQTTLGIQDFYDLPADIVGGQIEAAMNDVQPEVVKIGMIRTPETLATVINALRHYRPRHVVYDAVATSAGGEVLVPEAVMSEISRHLLPLCTCVVKLDGRPAHGRANRYASALAVFLSRGETVAQARALASQYLERCGADGGAHPSRASELHQTFLALVEQHVRQNSDVHFYADRMNLSARYLAQVTRRIAGQSPKAIIDERLVREIEHLLLTTGLTVQEIAYRCGFSAQAHLTKFFKKLRGTSPTAFRRARG